MSNWLQFVADETTVVIVPPTALITKPNMVLCGVCLLYRQSGHVVAGAYKHRHPHSADVGPVVLIVTVAVQCVPRAAVLVGWCVWVGHFLKQPWVRTVILPSELL